MSYEYWKQKRGDRPMPAESDLDPAEIRKILPHVILLDVRQEPLDFHYRLIGTKMDQHMLGRYPGLWMSQIHHQRSPSRVWTNCRRVARAGRPLSGDNIGRAHVCTPDTNAQLVCRLLLRKNTNKHKTNTTK